MSKNACGNLVDGSDEHEGVAGGKEGLRGAGVLGPPLKSPLRLPVRPKARPRLLLLL